MKLKDIIEKHTERYAPKQQERLNGTPNQIFEEVMLNCMLQTYKGFSLKEVYFRYPNRDRAWGGIVNDCKDVLKLGKKFPKIIDKAIMIRESLKKKF